MTSLEVKEDLGDAVCIPRSLVQAGGRERPRQPRRRAGVVGVRRGSSLGARPTETRRSRRRSRRRRTREARTCSFPRSPIGGPRRASEGVRGPTQMPNRAGACDFSPTARPGPRAATTTQSTVLYKPARVKRMSRRSGSRAWRGELRPYCLRRRGRSARRCKVAGRPRAPTSWPPVRQLA